MEASPSTDPPKADNPTPDWIRALTLDDLAKDAQTITARLRQEAPLAWIPALHSWVASTWSLCQAIAKDAENFSGGETAASARVLGTSVLTVEGDLLADLRYAMGSPVSARAIRDQVEQRMRPTARHYVEQIREKGQAELMAKYFEPISVRCVADSYGFFDVDTDTLRRWFHALAAGVVNVARNSDGSFADPAGFAEADRARADITQYVRSKADVADNAISRLLSEATPQGETRSVEYLLPSLLVVLLGGLQEPGHACSNTFLGLTGNVEQLRRVVANPALIPRAVAEGLRWMSPLYAGPPRSPRHDLTYAGASLHAGETVRLAYGSANHDGGQFDDPEVFDLERPAHSHLAFGVGRHSCLGSAIAPQIARVALEELFAAFPDIAIDPARPPVARGWAFLGPPELHVRWGSATPPPPARIVALPLRSRSRSVMSGNPDVDVRAGVRRVEHGDGRRGVHRTGHR